MAELLISAWLLPIGTISGAIAFARSRQQRPNAKLVLMTSAAASSIAAVICVAYPRLPDAAFVLLTALAVFAAALIETLDHTSRYYFNESAYRVAKFLPVGWSTPGAARSYIAYARQYLPRRHLVSMLVLWSGFALYVISLGQRLPASADTLARMSLVLLWLFCCWPRRPKAHALSPTEERFLAMSTTIQSEPLRRAGRLQNVSLVEPPAELPRTIVVIINESAGSWITSSNNANLRLDRCLRELSGTPDHWFVPGNAITNSPCTEISIPSMLTGAAPYEDIGRVHTLPFVFDLAKARGYETAFFTSSTLDWANFKDFFAGAAIDELASADTLGMPFVNDLAADDYPVTQRAVEWLAGRTGNSLLVLYLNALHTPFHTASSCGIPPSITEPHKRATYITEACHKVIFDALKAQGRYNDSLILSVGDHGEVTDSDGDEEHVRKTRLCCLPESVMRPLFLMKPPRDLPAAMTMALRANATRLVSHLDVAPSISHILGVNPKVAGGGYLGSSLFRPVATDRVIYTLTVNQWRSWSKAAVAISDSTGRLVLDQTSEELCTFRDFSGGDGTPASRDRLLLEAEKVELVRRNIAAIYREKLGLRPLREL